MVRRSGERARLSEKLSDSSLKGPRLLDFNSWSLTEFIAVGLRDFIFRRLLAFTGKALIILTLDPFVGKIYLITGSYLTNGLLDSFGESLILVVIALTLLELF